MSSSRSGKGLEEEEGMLVLAYIRALDALNNGRLRRQEGQALVEYALIISLVAVFLVAALTFMRDRIANIFSSIGSSL
jgi:Flp pilus assembly pilin Flp